MVAAVTTVFLLAYADSRREQARALDDFIAEQSALARFSADAMSARLDGVVRDLESTAALEDATHAAIALHRLVENDSPYVVAALRSMAGGAWLEASASGHTTIASSSTMATARELLARDPDMNDVQVSAPLAGEAAEGRLRLVALRHEERIVVLLVDLERLLRGRNDATKATDPPHRIIVLDDSRRSLTLGHDDQHASGVATLLAQLADARTGATLLTRETAASLGLPPRLAVAAFAPVPVRRGHAWSMVLIASARRVRDRARMSVYRLAAATGVASLLVALFGVSITRQQRREQALADALHLAEATSALRERSEKMIEAIPIGVLALDRTRQVTSTNPYLQERGVRTGPTLAHALPHATADELGQLDALLVDARERRAATERTGISLHLAHGERRDIDAYAIPLGRPLADVECFLVLHDRTAVRALERNLVRAEKLATIGTLAAGVAHEVGTPLGIISGRAEQLLERVPTGDPCDPTRKSVMSILTQVDKVSTTIRQLLDFARIRPIDAELVTPVQALRNAAALLDHRFRHAKVALHVDVAVGVPAVAADPGQLEQVLVNLLMNACDACTEGGRVWVRANESGARVAIEICDDGAGIPAEALSLVLDPFFTTKKRGQGTGLGLTIAADIVKNHGGVLEIESVVGEGTTMRVLLPRAIKEPAVPSSNAT